VTQHLTQLAVQTILQELPLSNADDLLLQLPMLHQHILYLLVLDRCTAKSAVQITKSHPETWPTRIQLTCNAVFAERMLALEEQQFTIHAAHMACAVATPFACGHVRQSHHLGVIRLIFATDQK
jgi:hypothetical protein